MATAIHSVDQVAETVETCIYVVELGLQNLPGYRRVPGTRIMVHDLEADSRSFSGGSLRLLPEAWTKRFRRIRKKAQDVLGSVDMSTESESYAGLPQGCYPLPKAKFEEVQHRIEQINEGELKDTTEELVTEWPTIQQRLKSSIPSEAAWAIVSKKLPAEKDLRSIHIRFARLPFTFLTDLGRPYAAALAKNIIDGIAGSIAEEVERLGEVAANGTLRNASFSELRKKFQQLRDWRFLANDEVMTKLQQAESQILSYGDQIGKALNFDTKTGGKAVVDLCAVVSGVSTACRRINDTRARPLEDEE